MAFANFGMAMSWNLTDSPFACHLLFFGLHAAARLVHREKEFCDIRFSHSRTTVSLFLLNVAPEPREDVVDLGDQARQKIRGQVWSCVISA
jgi:hypothetical protein